MPTQSGAVHHLEPRPAARVTVGERPVRRTCELPGPWLTAAQNELIARALCGAAGHERAAVDAVIDAQAGRRAIEVFATLLPVGWG